MEKPSPGNDNYYVQEQLDYTRSPETRIGWRRRYDFALQHVRKGDRVLDCGCGLGEGAHMIADRGASVVGIDIDNHFINYCTKAWPDVEFHRQDAAQGLPFPENHFDVVVCLEVLEHVPSRHSLNKTVAQIHRIIKPGGFFVVSGPNSRGGENNSLKRFVKLRLLRIIGRYMKKQARWHEHYRFWTPENFSAFLAQYFSAVSVFGERKEGITQDVERAPCLIARAKK